MLKVVTPLAHQQGSRARGVIYGFQRRTSDSIAAQWMLLATWFGKPKDRRPLGTVMCHLQIVER